MSLAQIVGAAIIAYLIGSIPSGVIATRLANVPDVRYSGSGNTGGTNTMRLAGPWVGAGVVIFDGFKGILAWAVAYIIMLGSTWALPIAGLMAVIGHCWPIYTKFHGGMGLATAGSLIFILAPTTLLFIIPIWGLFYFRLFKRTYSPRAVALSIIIGIALRLVFLPMSDNISWYLILVAIILFIRHLPEWNRRI